MRVADKLWLFVSSEFHKYIDYIKMRTAKQFRHDPIGFLSVFIAAAAGVAWYFMIHQVSRWLVVFWIFITILGLGFFQIFILTIQYPKYRFGFGGRKNTWGNQNNKAPPLPDEARGMLITEVGDRCENPNCGSPYDLDVHHIMQRQHGGSNELDNLIVLCNPHHDDADYGRLRVSQLRAWISRRYRFKNEGRLRQYWYKKVLGR